MKTTPFYPSLRVSLSIMAAAITADLPTALAMGGDFDKQEEAGAGKSGAQAVQLGVQKVTLSNLIKEHLFGSDTGCSYEPYQLTSAINCLQHRGEQDQFLIIEQTKRFLKKGMAASTRLDFLERFAKCSSNAVEPTANLLDRLFRDLGENDEHSLKIAIFDKLLRCAFERREGLVTFTLELLSMIGPYIKEGTNLSWHLNALLAMASILKEEEGEYEKYMPLAEWAIMPVVQVVDPEDAPYPAYLAQLLLQNNDDPIARLKALNFFLDTPKANRFPYCMAVQEVCPPETPADEKLKILFMLADLPEPMLSRFVAYGTALRRLNDPILIDVIKKLGNQAAPAQPYGLVQGLEFLIDALMKSEKNAGPPANAQVT